MSKPRAVIVENHLYGFGGGAQAVLKFAYALDRLGYEILVCGKRPIAVQNLQELGRLGIPSRAYYRGCAHGADLLLNIDHAGYELPLANVNLAHIFHPHRGNDPRGAKGIEKYRFSANSGFTAQAMAAVWKIEAPWLYIPINRNFYQARKRPQILHVSRFSRPTEVADKGHYEMIRAFQSICDVGLQGWEFIIAGSLEEPNYSNELRGMAQKYPISFITNASDEAMANIYAESAIYWHATGASMRDIPSAQEHLGLTTLEAMASGTVPVVLGSGGQLEILFDKGCGILCPDMHALAQETLELIGNLSLWAEYSQKCIPEAARWQDHDAFVERVGAWIAGQPIPDLPPAAARQSQFTPSDVTVVVPIHNGLRYTTKMLTSLLGTTPNVGRIVVVDNDSTDGSLDAIKPLLRKDDVTISRANDNYAEANNAAKPWLDTPLVLAANNDLVFMDQGWLENMCWAMDHSTGVVGAKLLFPDGRLQHAGGMLDWNRPDIGYHRFYPEQDSPVANQKLGVNYVTGALLLCRRELWDWDPLAGGLNYEDVDLCLKAKQAGWRVVYQPAARACHYQGMTKAEDPEWQDNFANPLSRSSINSTEFVARWYEKYRTEQPQWRLDG
jgi:GT2 family glycosyltransferase/glycosyltransferase involved in cell wall biosynthesis